MWSRKTLLKERYAETNKPIRYSRSPIKLRTQYRRVYLTTPSLLKISLQKIYNEDKKIASSVANAEPTGDREVGDVAVGSMRYYLNPAFDLLKIVYFFSEVKRTLRMEKNDFYVPKNDYTIIFDEGDWEIVKMYPDVYESKRVKVLVYRS